MLYFALIGLMISACSTDYTAEIASADQESVAFAEEAAVSSAGAIALPAQQKIIKTGRMGIRVGRLDRAEQRVDSLLPTYGGYYSGEEWGENYRQMTIRLPSGQFDAFVAALEANDKGKIAYKSISVQDVGEQYYDMQTRLENKRITLERYRDILRRAATVKDIMEVEQYIRQLEEEIESAEGRLRYWDNQIAYSTLELNLSTEQLVAPSKNTFITRLHRAVAVGWKGIVSIVVGLFYLWPLWLIGSGACWLIRWQIRRKRK